MKIPFPKFSKRASIIVVAVAATVLALGGTSAYAAKSNALPGSALYPLKQAWEEVRLLTAMSPVSKAQTHIDIAHDRITSAQAAVSQTPAPAAVLVPALQEVKQQLNAALSQSSNVTDPTKRKEIKDSISKEAADAEGELEHSSESESSSGNKQDLKTTSDQIRQIHDQASSND
jgi:spermidine/putrescine-binding protein